MSDSDYTLQARHRPTAQPHPAVPSVRARWQDLLLAEHLPDNVLPESPALPPGSEVYPTPSPAQVTVWLV